MVHPPAGAWFIQTDRCTCVARVRRNSASDPSSACLIISALVKCRVVKS